MGKYNMFTDLKTPRDVTAYTLFRGTTDFTQLQQFDLYESGYPYLVLVSIPDFLKKMAERDPEVARLVDSYTHILEYEFRGLSGLDNITSETAAIENGYQSMNVITKTTAPSASTFSMNYYEKSGSIITKMHELYLRSVKDPATGFKTYNGLIGFENDMIQPQDAGFHKECFSFLYMHTDNTGMLLEQAVYLVGCMPTTAELSDLYNSTKGDIQFKEIGVEFSGFPIRGAAVNARAKKILDWMNSSANANMVHRNSWDYNYAGLGDTTNGLAQAKLTSK